ncbi:tRNA (adenosine(37)-N6)-threonylcarbamoyltransferase complex ATPase subunit type 1 TsaE [Georhizobium profundi]|uniref:tRNA threonylcarbamoyladenosine biosynthesis protein TsaE n=1 Tax=Georhizobium profundi TaxID=2341112 RepID=A0A3S9B035_9HYPH|nr:tRNA (adenosine(37)-N6)-threonylcarbamoyltransferase complex ATPase subunit type 1 TsaE [Georhizobium profundi]AZN70289.1 tRNA (adenosine(37)-N6)-threonylcarbamoyltransferase complex ATPase subunit type 1 TsaE [Georhizobium profundi]
MGERLLHLADQRATERLAEDIAVMLRNGDVLALSGELGAGKSTFARALIRAVADDPDLDVPSPTFTLVQSYELRLTIAHFDLYRITDPDELAELGFDEAVATGVVLVEWPERAGNMLPERAIHLTIAEGETADARTVHIRAPDQTIARIDRTLAARAFLDASGFKGVQRRFLLGDASSRAYERLVADGASPFILMNAPAQPDGPIIRDGKPYSRIAHLAEDVRPFVAMAKWLKSKGFSAPDIRADDLEQGFLIVENLGSEGLLDPSGAPIEERYTAAVEALAQLHVTPVPGALPVGSETYHLPAYDLGAMQIEVELLVDWYLAHERGTPPSATEREDYITLWRQAVASLEGSEAHVVLRDYHSPNLIWRGDRERVDRLGIIDFQDAMLGPTAYDVASIVQDARVTIEQPMADRLVAAYVAARHGLGPFDEPAFRRALALMQAQRGSKILGIFVRLKQRDGKPGYLRHLPRMRSYVAEALRHPDLAELRSWYETAGVFGSGAGDDRQA